MDAITQPSAQAFTVLGLRAEQFANTLGDKFKLLWINFKEWAIGAMTDAAAALAKVLTTGPLAILFPKLGAMKNSAIDAVGGAAKSPFQTLAISS